MLTIQENLDLEIINETDDDPSKSQAWIQDGPTPTIYIRMSKTKQKAFESGDKVKITIVIPRRFTSKSSDDSEQILFKEYDGQETLVIELEGPNQNQQTPNQNKSQTINVKWRVVDGTQTMSTQYSIYEKGGVVPYEVRFDPRLQTYVLSQTPAVFEEFKDIGRAHPIKFGLSKKFDKYVFGLQGLCELDQLRSDTTTKTMSAYHQTMDLNCEPVKLQFHYFDNAILAKNGRYCQLTELNS